MHVFLMFKDRDFNPEQTLPWNGADLTQDMQLDQVIKAMAADDEFYYRVAQTALLTSLGNDIDVVHYRQAVLKDCMKNLKVIRKLYKLAVSVTGEKKISHWASDLSPMSMLSRAVETLQVFLGTLHDLRNLADKEASTFESEGFTEFFARIKAEINDEYLSEIEEHLRGLNLRDEVLIGARLGKGNRGSDYCILRKPDDQKTWVERAFKRGPKSYTFRINDQDETAVRKLSELKNRGINSLVNITAQSVDHILNFLIMLRTELAFYLGCINLQKRLDEIGEPACFPVPVPPDERTLIAEDLYDISLALSMGQKVVANNIDADGKSLIMVTGANKGGKTTFLRSVGLSQMMMHSGIIVPAGSFSANLCTGLFTHFKHREDVSLESGRLDDELNRMSLIADRLSAHSLVLLNEAFAATNEREGSEIARQIVAALIEKQVKIIFVSHLFQFAQDIHRDRIEGTLFLRAERKEDGTRTYKLSEGEPLDTSYGVDLYNKIFTDEGREINA
ncbi:MAG: hypothetical protein JW712_12495 [Dehalococcoidales bacterium]|nr:hypothetical protein [Dehalococcoidales bacterium]